MTGPQPIAVTAPVRDQIRILVVDDCQDFADLLRLGLEMAGYDARAAGSAGEALACAETFLPDIICTDLGMPGMSGIELAQHLRHSGHAEGTIWIAITGWADVRSTKGVMDAGFDLCLVKPVGFEFLLEHIERLLAQRTVKHCPCDGDRSPAPLPGAGLR